MQQGQRTGTQVQDLLLLATAPPHSPAPSTATITRYQIYSSISPQRIMLVFWEKLLELRVGNVGLVNANVTGQNNVGALVGYSNTSSSIDNSYAIGSVSGTAQGVGGLVGLE